MVLKQGCSVERLDENIYYCRELSWRTLVFRDRWDAGRKLARLLQALLDAGLLERPARVYAIPAGGVPVGIAVAEAFKAKLDIVPVKKATYPWTSEAGFGAVAPSGAAVIDHEVAETLGPWAREALEQARERVEERLRLLRGSAEYPRLNGEPVLVVDDGIAAGWTMLAATRFLSGLGARVYAAAPTGSVEGSRLVAGEAEAVVVANLRGGPVFAVADAYAEWRDLGDAEVLEMLEKARARGLYDPAS